MIITDIAELQKLYSFYYFSRAVNSMSYEEWIIQCGGCFTDSATPILSDAVEFVDEQDYLVLKLRYGR